jgi:hypothetical protein
VGSTSKEVKGKKRKENSFGVTLFPLFFFLLGG